MRSILIIGTLTLVGIAGLWFLFGDSTEVFELLYSSPTTIRIEGDTIDLDIVIVNLLGSVLGTQLAMEE